MFSGVDTGDSVEVSHRDRPAADSIELSVFLHTVAVDSVSMYDCDWADAKHAFVCVVGVNMLTANLLKEVVNVLHKVETVVFNDCIGGGVENVLWAFTVVALEVDCGLQVTDEPFAPFDVVLKRLRLLIGTGSSSDGAEIESIPSVYDFVRLIPVNEFEQGFGGILVHHVSMVVRDNDELNLLFSHFVLVCM